MGGKRCLFFYYEMRSKYIPSERRKVCRGRSDRPITVIIIVNIKELKLYKLVKK